MSRVAIVNTNDEIIGSEERSIVYQKGLIHRLIRVLLFNSKGQIVLQWRSATEDTFPNTWDQSAGGHVDAGEDYETAARRELEEELGAKDVKLELINKFYTEGEIGPKIIKRFNAVFAGFYDGEFTLQKEEVEKVAWFDINELYKLIEEKKDLFTPGLITVLKDNKEAILKYTKQKN